MYFSPVIIIVIKSRRGKSPLVPIGWKAGWAPELVWRMWRRENSCSYEDSKL
jgi:hypothetical protein